MLSTSAVRSFNACKRKYFYAYELKRRPKKTTNALALGTLVHHALEAWWRWWQVNDQRELGGAIWVIEHKTTSRATIVQNFLILTVSVKKTGRDVVCKSEFGICCCSADTDVSPTRLQCQVLYGGSKVNRLKL
jgi:hypothetical protein